jgi:flagellar basal-body rod protein FlgF
MDRLAYIAMTGARALMERQASVANNLANASTTGFRGELNALRAVPVLGEGESTRAFVTDSTPGSDYTPGAMEQTGRSLDIAIQGKGWLAVLGADGFEAYTRDGALQVNASRQLVQASGRVVLGEGGPISIPANAEVAVGRDGLITARLPGAQNSTPVGKLKLVNPPERELARGNDGLFRLAEGATAPSDRSVAVASGYLEKSNVNVAEAMVEMIALSRQFELQTRLIQNSEQNSRAAAQLFNIS